MKVQLITKDNAYGLSQDVAVLRSALVGISGDHIQVDFNDWRTPKPVAAGHYDLNVFLEEIPDIRFCPQAKRNVLVPNPEWFWNVKHLAHVDEVWAKTHDCARIFKRYHKRVKYIGWTSGDRYLPEVPKEKIMVHLAGASSAKGTAEVIVAMRKRPRLRLTLASERPVPNCPPNVEQVGRLDAEAFVLLQNRAAIHLCPSSYEGFGHYLNEARSVGAVIITTNAEPMTELVGPAFGFGAASSHVTTQNLAVHKHVDAVSLGEMIDLAMGLELPSLLNLGLNARAAYLAGREEFLSNLKAVL